MTSQLPPPGGPPALTACGGVADAAVGGGRGGHRDGDGGTGGHEHAISQDADRRYLLTALVLMSGFMAAEVIVALLSGSLALLSDAGHMLSDVGAIGGSLWAMALAARPPSGKWTYGWRRAEILSAAVNGITLLVVAGIVTAEAIGRLIHPPRVEGGLVIAVAVAGIGVNIAATWVLARADRSSLNVEGAFRHVLTDLYGFIGTVIAGIIIVTTGFTRADAIASLIVVVLMAKAAWGLLRDSGLVLLEAAPEDTDLEEVRAHILSVPHVKGVHDLHAWTVTSGLPTLSAHVIVEDSCFQDGHAPRLLDQLQACLAGDFDIEHSTFQLESAAHEGHEPGTH